MRWQAEMGRSKPWHILLPMVEWELQSDKLGPPRNPPDTDTWSGSDKSATNQCQLAQRPHQALQEIPQIPTHGVGVTNRPPTNVNLPNGRIRPSKKSPRY